MEESRDITFVFTDYPAEPLNVNGEYYFYASSNYFFASGTSVSATLDFQKADGSLFCVDVTTAVKTTNPILAIAENV